VTFPLTVILAVMYYDKRSTGSLSMSEYLVVLQVTMQRQL